MPKNIKNLKLKIIIVRQIIQIAMASFMLKNNDRQLL